MKRTTCLIAGGGPAGIMLGLLLARGGVEVIVCEKHADFLRDFRGDTVHPSTIRLLDELGLGAEFAQLPQSRLQSLRVPTTNGQSIDFGDFSALPPPYNYVAMIPQWDFLAFLAGHARRESSFTLLMETEVTGLLWQDGKVTGVSTRTQEHEEPITADLVVACDGRHSVLREQAGFIPRDYQVPFDVWWFRLPRHADEQAEPASLVPSFAGRDILLSIAREGFYQMAAFIPKGTDAQRRAEGTKPLRAMIARLRPDLADRVDTLTSMDQVKTLDVRLDRLKRWHRPGLLCIGDAAHAMSPAGGVGINLAIQDAVAAARILRHPLRAGTLSESDLEAVQRRRMLPTRVIQTMQRILHRIIFQNGFETGRAGPPRFMLFLARHVPGFRKLPARFIGFGPRPESAPDFARRPR
ncbi:FAD-dependent oxidoreductase [Pelagibacterium halotolerans]|uniref:2-polyprenyl-6-methoxyphenol hydroxylase-related FAD-dependent oxidoreductase n=1 Tax=Pelagibacterium halotolerans (strain DSM 22347 / JCM 15775 / CGMCC 1.7692 / B2) TaxID=1082931 RepID=G4REW2_PELHB|nr:FAD-dependent oxidoreductase [Pelagibacterium halotolerans]AEQ51933.1 2-polyprenyl-6-methoxyphenol hydroxylase-related FAD-dependent oxidoreductase [Pelagibacterium halotolerans B2]QJR18273.1 FAD-dependent oxidoreductase [Pelagibacterium halotolerans]SEA27382.1 2-polyprenyl-6-methoxyphenol hydroxylase [Pelagibacterium halotolerans]